MTGNCPPPDLPGPLTPCQAPGQLPVHQGLRRSPAGPRSPRTASHVIFPGPLQPPAPHRPGSPASAAFRPARLLRTVAAGVLERSRPGGPRPAPRPGRDVRAHGGARLTCSGARDSGQSHCRHRTPPSSAARPSDRAARRPGDRGRGSGRGLLRTREGLGEWAGTRAGLRGGGAWPEERRGGARGETWAGSKEGMGVRV